MAQTARRLQLDECESKVQQCREVHGVRSGKATAETREGASPEAGMQSYFGFWICAFGLKRDLHAVINPKSQIQNPKSIRGGQCLYLEFRQAAP
jgi:hypothetical protein